MKTYLSETGVSLVDEFGNFVKRNRKTLPNYIERDGYFFSNRKEEDLQFEEYLYQRGKNK